MADWGLANINPDTSSTSQAGLSSGSGSDAVAAAISATPNSGSWIGNVAGDTLAAIPNLVDDVASSVSKTTGIGNIQKGDVNNKMLQAIGIPGVTNFFADNKGGIAAASGILGTIAATYATDGLASEALPFVSALKAVPYGRKIMALDSDYQKAIQAVNAIDTGIAARGVLGAAQYTEAAGIGTSIDAAGNVIKAGEDLSRITAANAARRAGFLKDAAKFGAVEAVSATTLNQNDFLYSDDLGTNIANAALGAGIGGLIGSVGANWAMRKWVSSSRMQKIYADALDASGTEAGRLDASYLPKFMQGDVNAPSVVGGLYGHFADDATSYMVSARATAKEGVDISTQRRLGSQFEGEALQAAQKFTVKGLQGIPSSGFDIDSPGFGNALADGLHNDSGMLVGAERIGGIGTGMSIMDTIDDGAAKLERRFAKNADTLGDGKKLAELSDNEIMAIRADQKQIKIHQGLVPMPFIDGEFTSLDHAASFDNWYEPVIKPETNDGLRTWQSYEPGGKGHGVGIDQDMSLYFPGMTTGLNNADHFDILRLYRSAQQMAGEVAASPTMKLAVPANPNWFQLDLAEHILQKSEGRANVIFPAGMNRAQAQVESFAQKAEILQGAPATADFAKLRVRLNLPKLTAYESGLMSTTETPQEILLRGAGSPEAIRSSTLDQLKSGIVASKSLTDLTAANKIGSKPVDLTGNSFNFLTDYRGQPTSPLLVYKRPMLDNSWTKDNLAERLATRKIQVLKGLTGPEADDFTRALTTNIATNPEAQMAAKATGLSETQMQAATPGFGNLSPTTPIRSLTDQFSTFDWKFRDNPIIRSMVKVREGAERLAQQHMTQTFESAFEDSLSRLNGPRSEQSRVLLDQYYSHAGGWQLVEPNLQTGEGVVNRTAADGQQMTQFVLQDNAENQTRFRAVHGRDMEPGETLKTPKGNVIELDPLAYEIHGRFQQITDGDRIQKNVINNAVGQPEIRRAFGYAPPLNPEGKIIGFTYDPTMKIVPDASVYATTQADFDRAVLKMRQDPNSPMNREGHTFMTMDEIRNRPTLLSQAQMEMQNPGRTFIAGNKTALGKSGQQDIQIGRFQDAMTSMRNNYIQHGRDVTELLFQDSIRAAKMRAEIAANRPSVVAGNPVNAKRDRSVFDYYQQAATGQRPTNIGKSWLETKADGLISDTSQRLNNAWAQAAAYFREASPYSLSKDESAAWATMRDNLAPHMPFQSAADYAEAKGFGSLPPTMRGISQALNQFECTWKLRVLEPIQGVIHLGGVLNAAPSIIRHLSWREGDDLESYAFRNGNIADIYNNMEEGKSYGVLSAGKALYGGFKKAMSSAFDEDMDFAAKQGTLSQSMNEFTRSFRAADTRSGLDRFLNGTPYPTATSAIGQKFQQKGLIGWTSLLTDKSLDFSRQWSHAMGLNIADELGIEVLAARHDFAHDIANKMIANHSPMNSPEVFSGAIGAPIGLFSSFMRAYYERIFRYIETGDGRAVATQYAMQAGMFGLKTVPGFKEYNDTMNYFADGKKSPYDNFIERFGPQAGSILMSGALGNIPTLFGGKGLDLSARGDANYRMPSISRPPILDTAEKLFNGVGAGIGLFSKNSPNVTSQQIAEIVGNAMPMRSVGGMIEQLGANGDSTDSKGVLTAQAHDLMDSAARMLGTRTVSQSQENEAYYANKTAMEMKSAQDDVLRRNTRAAMRAGDEDLNGVFDRYVANGGDPKAYKSWMKNNYKVATETRGQRQLDASMKNPSQQYAAERLLNAHTGIDSEENEPEPNDENYGGGEQAE